MHAHENPPSGLPGREEKPDVCLLVVDEIGIARVVRDAVRDLADALPADVMVLPAPTLQLAETQIDEADIVFIDIVKADWLKFATGRVFPKKLPMIATSTIEAHGKLRQYEDFRVILKPDFRLGQLNDAIVRMTHLVLRKRRKREFHV